MQLDRAFVAAGGLLLAAPDPVAIGDNLPGFGVQRQEELLVEAGFAPIEAIRIATLNGASFLGAQDRIGSILFAQLEEKTGPVALLNVFTVAPERPKRSSQVGAAPVPQVAVPGICLG
jgi:hypothetical protein